MKIITKISDLKKFRENLSDVALVPTMDALHQGHLSLIETAKQYSSNIIVSIFVNQAQFGPNEDFASYPKTLESDCEKLAALGVSAVFAPELAEIYHSSAYNCTQVITPELYNLHCGSSRPKFFIGIGTVVTILFNLVKPQYAVFGEKDYQQTLVVKKIVRDLFLPVKIITTPLYREADGLAMSSRNVYLSTEERQLAPQLYKQLLVSKQEIIDDKFNFKTIEDRAITNLQGLGFKVDYFTICDNNNLQPVQAKVAELRILAATYLGKTRLIDNILLDTT